MARLISALLLHSIIFVNFLSEKVNTASTSNFEYQANVLVHNPSVSMSFTVLRGGSSDSVSQSNAARASDRYAKIQNKYSKNLRSVSRKEAGYKHDEARNTDGIDDLWDKDEIPLMTRDSDETEFEGDISERDLPAGGQGPEEESAQEDDRGEGEPPYFNGAKVHISKKVSKSIKNERRIAQRIIVLLQ